jgi:hypothetical protein
MRDPDNITANSAYCDAYIYYYADCFNTDINKYAYSTYYDADNTGSDKHADKPGTADKYKYAGSFDAYIDEHADSTDSDSDNTGSDKHADSADGNTDSFLGLRRIDGVSAVRGNNQFDEQPASADRSGEHGNNGIEFE